MTVANILNTKGSDVFTLSAEMSLADAVKELATRRVGALVISDASRKVLGILSERDVVRALGKRGPDVLSDKVSAWMTREVVTCTEDTTIGQLMDIMTAGRFRHVPVVRDGLLHGIVSIGDVVKRRIAEIEYEAQELKTYIAS